MPTNKVVGDPTRLGLDHPRELRLQMVELGAVLSKTLTHPVGSEIPDFLVEPVETRLEVFPVKDPIRSRCQDVQSDIDPESRGVRREIGGLGNDPLPLLDGLKPPEPFLRLSGEDALRNLIGLIDVG